jgi:hypothetical protein
LVRALPSCPIDRADLGLIGIIDLRPAIQETCQGCPGYQVPNSTSHPLAQEPIESSRSRGRQGLAPGHLQHCRS